MKHIQLLSDWMYHAIEESFTCQFVSVTANGTPVALPVFLNHFDPDEGTLIISSPVGVKRLENVRRHPEVAMLFSQVGTGKGEPPPAISAEAEGSTSMTLLRYDPQRANEAYLLFYGQLAERGDTWSFSPARVVLR